MTARARTCRECGQVWSQRHARFCGWCGARLGEASEPPPRRPRNVATIAARALAAVGIVGLAIVVMSLDLTRPDADPTVELDGEELEPAPSPLSPDERASLRAQADPDQLRCEPRGCERWRIEADWTRATASGVVTLDNGLVVLPRAPRPDVLDLVAIDPSTGAPAWELEVLPGPTPGEGPRGPWARLMSGPHGVVVLAGAQATAVDQDGEMVWQWGLSELDISPGELWDHSAFDEVVVLRGIDGTNETDAGQLRQVLVALDRDDGSLRWSRDAQQTLLHDDVVAAVGDDGALERLDPATGEPRWRGPQLADGHRGLGVVGNWIAVREETGQRLIDAETGRRLDGFEGFLFAGPIEAADGIVAVVAEHDPAELMEDAAEIAVVHVDEDGSVAWRNSLGTVEPVWECCWIRPGPRNTVTVNTGRQEWNLHLETGATIAVVDIPAGRSRRAAVHELRPGLEVAWHDDHLQLATPQGDVTVRSDGDLAIVSVDPVIVGDGRHLLGIQLPSEDSAAAGDTDSDAGPESATEGG